MPDIKDSYTAQVQERASAAPPTPAGLIIKAVRIALAAMYDHILSVAACPALSTPMDEWLSDVMDWSDSHTSDGPSEPATLGQLAGRLQGAWAVPEFYQPHPDNDRYHEVRRALIVLPWAIDSYLAGKYPAALCHCRYVTEILDGYNQDARVEFARLHNQLKTAEDR